MSLALTRQDRSSQARAKEFAEKRLKRVTAKIEAGEFFLWGLPSRARDEQVSGGPQGNAPTFLVLPLAFA